MEISDEAKNRFWSHIQKSSTCWIWMAGKTNKGYGAAYLDGKKQIGAHRLSYLIHRGSIPDGLTIDHLCKNRACVNPSHLEVVSRAENTMRGDSIPALNARKTHCKNGHLLTDETVYRRLNRNGKPNRVCKVCARDHSAEVWKRKREIDPTYSNHHRKEKK